MGGEIRYRTARHAQVSLTIAATTRRRRRAAERALAAAAGGAAGIDLDVLIAGLPNPAAAADVALRLDSASINARLADAGLPAVQVTRAPAGRRACFEVCA